MIHNHYPQILILDNWFKYGYRLYLACINALSYEQAPLVLVYLICGWHDSSKPCPRRQPLQSCCGDNSCQNCDKNSMDLAELDAQFGAGCLGIKIMERLPALSGRRRALMTVEHMRMSVDDLDMDRINEFDTGNFGY